MSERVIFNFTVWLESNTTNNVTIKNGIWTEEMAELLTDIVNNIRNVQKAVDKVEDVEG